MISLLVQYQRGEGGQPTGTAQDQDQPQVTVPSLGSATSYSTSSRISLRIEYQLRSLQIHCQLKGQPLDTVTAQAKGSVFSRSTTMQFRDQPVPFRYNNSITSLGVILQVSHQLRDQPPSTARAYRDQSIWVQKQLRIRFGTRPV